MISILHTRFFLFFSRRSKPCLGVKSPLRFYIHFIMASLNNSITVHGGSETAIYWSHGGRIFNDDDLAKLHWDFWFKEPFVRKETGPVKKNSYSIWPRSLVIVGLGIWLGIRFRNTSLPPNMCIALDQDAVLNVFKNIFDCVRIGPAWVSIGFSTKLWDWYCSKGSCATQSRLNWLIKPETGWQGLIEHSQPSPRSSYHRTTPGVKVLVASSSPWQRISSLRMFPPASRRTWKNQDGSYYFSMTGLNAWCRCCLPSPGPCFKWLRTTNPGIETKWEAYGLRTHKIA